MIAILGGTFDPIHFGHLRPALEIVEKLSLSELRFIPSAKPPHRWQPEANEQHRLKMVKLAIKSYSKFVIDEREYDRLEKDGTASFTVDTVRSIREEIGQSESLGMIVGMDAFQSFTQWRDWEKILESVHLIVASRPGYGSFKTNGQLDNQNESQQQNQDHNQDHGFEWVKPRLTSDVNELHKNPSGKVFFCDVTQLDISATFIRNQIDNNKSCRYLTPKKVLKYIKKYNLYESWS